MVAGDLIQKILNSKSPVHVFTNFDNWKTEYKEYALLIHPDRCTLKGSSDALAKLNQYKDEIETGKRHSDDAGTVVYKVKTVTFTGIPALLKKSYENYNKLMALKDDASKNFQKYLPLKATLNGDTLEFALPHRAVPLSAVGTLEQKHVNWILSRMMEFSAWMRQIEYTHAGINPDSIYVIPENHGIIVTSFYHMNRIGSKMSTVSGRYLNFYPPTLLTEKIANGTIDLDLSKRTAIYLLGDKSGSGVKLRKTHNQEIIDFLQKQQNHPLDAYTEYRKLLKKYFDDKTFHKFDI